MATFENEKLVSINIKLSNDAANTVLSALKEKYGNGPYQEDEFKTKGGLEAVQITHIWKNGDDTLTAQSPSGKIDEMSVRLDSNIYLQKRLTERKEKADKDL